MGAKRSGGDGTDPGTDGASPRVRVAVALPSSPELPDGALQPGRSTAPETSSAVAPEAGVPEERESGTAAPVPPAGRETDGGGETAPPVSSSTAEGPDEEQAHAGETTGATSEAAGNEEPEGATSSAVAQTGDDGPPPGGEVATAHDGRPKKPMLAAAAIVGALLIGVPFALVGGEDKKQSSAQEQSQEESDTILGAGAASEEPGDFVTESPSASPSPSRTSASPSASATAGVPAKPKTEPSGESKASASPSRYPLSKATLNERPVWTSTSVTAPSTLSVGESWRTNRIRLTMQPDGNLVVYNEDNRPTWAAMTFGQNHKARFQTDGNLVILNADDRPIWAAGSYGHEGAKLILRADGKVVVMDGGTVVWST